MSDLNKVMLIGRLGKDPETRYSASGAAITNITLATSDKWKDKQTGEQKEKTEWHRVVFFNRLAEIAGEYLTKGKTVYIEGKIQTRKWQDQQGQDRYTTEIVANEMQMLGGREQPQQQSGGFRDKPKDSPPAQAQPAPAAQDEQFTDDDIPF